MNPQVFADSPVKHVSVPAGITRLATQAPGPFARGSAVVVRLYSGAQYSVRITHGFNNSLSPVVSSFVRVVAGLATDTVLVISVDASALEVAYVPSDYVSVEIVSTGGNTIEADVWVRQFAEQH